VLVGEEKDGTHRVGEKIMSKIEESNKREGEEKSKMPTLRQNWLVLLLLAMLFTTLVLAFPLFQEMRIRIEISEDVIVDVSVDTQKIPLIAKIIQPSYDVGVYTINVTIVGTGKNFTIENVPSGKYTIVWQSGLPSSGTYTIKVELFRVALRDELTLQVTF
jgi:hypothetical protein